MLASAPRTHAVTSFVKLKDWSERKGQGEDLF